MPPQGDQCPFCQLIENPEQLITVGETENFYAWLEVQPRARGHANVVPKEHKESILEFSPGEYHEAMTLTRETVQKAIDGLGADGVSITMNVKEAGGQMLPHAYIQIFPRFEEDENAGTPTGAIFQHREELQDQDRLREIQGEMNSVTPNFEAEKVEPHPESQRFKQETEDMEEENEEKDTEESKPGRGESIEWM
ncbi:MAG: HIT family protein [Candidatus Nanohalobium sp.]